MPRDALPDLVLFSSWSPPQVARHGHIELGSWWRYHDCSNPGWVLFVALTDGAAVVVGGIRRRLPAGRGVLLPPRLRFATEPGIGVPLSYVHFALPQLGDPGLAADRPTVLRDDPALAALAIALATTETTGAGGLTALALASQALAVAIASQPLAHRRQLLDCLEARRPLRPALDYIADHLAEPLYIPTLAQQCGQGPQWFTRSFKEAFGTTPAQYIIARRVEAVAARLLAGDEPLDQVAAACGFNDRFHLSRAFVRAYGVPPAAWRRQAAVERTLGANTSRSGGLPI